MEKKFKRVPVNVSVSDLSPLNITCSSTKCDEDLHCFKTSKLVVKKFGEQGVCKECGSKLIDWERVHKNDIKDSKFIFKSMKNELIRHVYWHTPIEKVAIDKAIKRGKADLTKHARKILQTKVGHAENYREGYQTAKTGNEIVNYAQHATATCCRKCMEYWHNIKMGKELTDEQLEFCTDLVMLYIEERVTSLPDKKFEKVKKT